MKMITFNFIQIFQRRKEREETRLSQEILQGFKKKPSEINRRGYENQ